MDARVRRYLIYGLAALALVTLAIMVLPQLEGVFDSAHAPIVWAFWISFIALVVILFFDRNVPGATEVQVEGPRVKVIHSLTSMGCPAGPMIQEGIHDAAAAVPGVENVEVELTWDPPWTPELPEDLKQEYGVDLTPEIKQQIVGGNIARLYGIDVPAKLEAIKDDEFARRRSEHLAAQAARHAGVVGTESR